MTLVLAPTSNPPMNDTEVQVQIALGTCPCDLNLMGMCNVLKLRGKVVDCTDADRETLLFLWLHTWIALRSNDFTVTWPNEIVLP